MRLLSQGNLVPLPWRSYQRSKVDGGACGRSARERRPAASFGVAAVQRQAAEVAVQLQRHRVPAAVIDATARDAHHAGAAARATLRLEPQLAPCQLVPHTHTHRVPLRPLTALKPCVKACGPTLSSMQGSICVNMIIPWLCRVLILRLTFISECSRS